MRRTDRELTGAALSAILEQGEYGVLSTVGPDGVPYSVPMSYAWKDGAIHLHCAADVGKKLENIAHCSTVCFVVVGRTAVCPEKFSTYYESVIVTGTIRPAEDKAGSLLALVEKYSPGYLEQGRKYIAAAAHETGVYVITPQAMTGKAHRKTT